MQPHLVTRPRIDERAFLTTLFFAGTSHTALGENDMHKCKAPHDCFGA